MDFLRVRIGRSKCGTDSTDGHEESESGVVNRCWLTFIAKVVGPVEGWPYSSYNLTLFRGCDIEYGWNTGEDGRIVHELGLFKAYEETRITTCIVWNVHSDWGIVFTYTLKRK